MVTPLCKIHPEVAHNNSLIKVSIIPVAGCGDREDLPLYGILISSPSYREEPLGGGGAGIAEHVERRRDAGAETES